MKYVNADDIFPKELLKEIQKYIHGRMVYIPTPEKMHKKWGEKSESREQLSLRNETIRQTYFNGKSIDELSNEFGLSYESIKKIIYSRK